MRPKINRHAIGALLIPTLTTTHAPPQSSDLMTCGNIVVAFKNSDGENIGSPQTFSPTQRLNSGQVGKTATVSITAGGISGTSAQTEEIIAAVTNLPDGIFAAWPLLIDGSDITLQGNDLTNNNGISFDPIQGASFNGSNQTLSLSGPILAGQAITLVGWFTINSFSGIMNTMAGQWNNDGFYFAIIDGSLLGGSGPMMRAIWIESDGSSAHDWSFPLTGYSDGVQFFAALRYDPDSDTMSAWFNDVKSDFTNAGGMNASVSQPFDLGAGYIGGYDFFGGLQINVNVWSRALTDPEIAILYGGGATFIYPFS